MVARKDHPETSPAGQQDKADAQKADKAGASVADAVAVELEQGFRGVEVDPTPNENYTVAGVTSGAPTPETDPEAAEAARVARVSAESKAAGVGER